MITDNRTIDSTSYPNAPPEGVLVMLMGLPRAGKSTWARATGYPIVDCDAIRLTKTGQRWWGPIEHEIWATARTMVRALFMAGHPIVILDITSLRRDHRDMFISSPDVPWRRYVQWINTDPNTCKLRALDSYPVLVDIIDWFHANQEPITEDENIQLCGHIKDGEVLYQTPLTEL